MSNRLFQSDGVRVIPSTDSDPRYRFIDRDIQSRSAVGLDVTDYCVSTNTSHVAGPSTEVNNGVYSVIPFGAVASEYRNIRCTQGEELQYAAELMTQGGSVSAAEFALWNAIPAWDNTIRPSLQNTDVSTISVASLPASAAAPSDILASLMIRRASLTPLDDGIVHLGIGAAMALAGTGQIYADGGDVDAQVRIRATDNPVVISPYYPIRGYAMTGPIVVVLDEVSGYQTYDISQNRTRIRANQLITIVFDPSTSVRAV